MNSRLAKGGFTLIEILVAVAIVAAILSMVYGSYFAVAGSTEACEARIEVSQQMQQVLAQMARQIRCAYVPASLYTAERVQQSSGKVGETVTPAKSTSRRIEAVSEDTPDYFSGHADGLSGEVLHFVTTDASSAGPEAANGLSEVAYRLDRSKALLLVSQSRFVQTPGDRPKDRDWQPLLSGVEHFELTFSDGQKWLRQWDFKDRRRAPYAVRIDITCEDRNHRRCRYATLAHIACRHNERKKTTSDTPVSFGEQ